METTYNNLPEAITQLRTDVSEIKRLLLEKSNEHQPEGDTLLTIDGAASLLSLSRATLYGYTARAEIPFSKIKKRLYFSKQELTNWVKAGRRSTVSEIEAGAENHLATLKKKH